MNIEVTIGLQSISIFNVMEYCKSKQRQSIFNSTFNFQFVSKIKNGMNEWPRKFKIWYLIFKLNWILNLTLKIELTCLQFQYSIALKKEIG